jgi:dTDP-4-dehydrorhamnose reductase
MKILVTGANGQLGSTLSELGVTLHLNMVALTRTELDITDPIAVQAAFDRYSPDILINAAAYTAVDKAESEPELAFAINEYAPALLAKVCAMQCIPLLHISTDYVFDGEQSSPYTEQDAVHPIGVYARSKEAGERAVRESLRKHIILRTSWVFSPEGACFPNTILRLAKERSSLSVVSDQRGGPTSARSIALCLLQIAKRYETEGDLPWGTYHFSQTPYVSWFEFATQIVGQAKTAGLLSSDCEVKPCGSEQYPTPVKRPANSCLQIAKIQANFRIEESRWEDDLKQLINAG